MSPLEQSATRRIAEPPVVIDRYFPDCRSATVEAIAKSRLGIRDFGKIYGFHTFYYQRPEGPVAFRSNGVELDLWFHRAEPAPQDLEAAIEAVYGVRTLEHRFDRFEPYLAFCSERLQQNVPLVAEFDLGFIEQRREYGKVFGPHMIVLSGCEGPGDRILAVEQMLGAIAIGIADFRACFERRCATGGSASLWDVTVVGSGERELSREETLARVGANLDNLDSSGATLGLAALDRFRADLEEHLRGPDFRERPFSIPGFWVFSHERHVQRKWLRAIRALCPPAYGGTLEALDATLAKLFNAWLSADYLMEKCLASGNGRALKSLPLYLRDIAALERSVRDQWRELKVALGG